MSPHLIIEEAPILITGANGFIGSQVVNMLLERGFSNLRCLVRTSGKSDRLNEVLAGRPKAQVQILTGNLLSREDCKRAVSDVRWSEGQLPQVFNRTRCAADWKGNQ